MIETITQQEQARNILLELGFPVHRSGYRRLRVAIPCFAQNPEQSLTKELYPRIAKQVGCTTNDVESSIRRSILCAWEHGNQDAWKEYFPRCRKAPSNMVFIATLAEHLK